MQRAAAEMSDSGGVDCLSVGNSGRQRQWTQRSAARRRCSLRTASLLPKTSSPRDRLIDTRDNRSPRNTRSHNTHCHLRVNSRQLQLHSTQRRLSTRLIDHSTSAAPLPPDTKRWSRSTDWPQQSSSGCSLAIGAPLQLLHPPTCLTLRCRLPTPSTIRDSLTQASFGSLVRRS